MSINLQEFDTTLCNLSSQQFRPNMRRALRLERWLCFTMLSTFHQIGKASHAIVCDLRLRVRCDVIPPDAAGFQGHRPENRICDVRSIMLCMCIASLLEVCYACGRVVVCTASRLTPPCKLRLRSENHNTSSCVPEGAPHLLGVF